MAVALRCSLLQDPSSQEESLQHFLEPLRWLTAIELFLPLLRNTRSESGRAVEQIH